MAIDFFKPTGNSEIDELTNLITDLVAMPDEALDTDKVDSIIGAMNGAITPKQREEVIVEFVKHMEQHPNEDVITPLKESIQSLYEELESLSQEKIRLIQAIFDIIIQMAEEAQERVGNGATVVQFELYRESAKLPTYAHDTDAGCDIYAPEDVVIPAGTLGFKVDTGLKMAMKPGWELQIRPRSGLSMKTGLRISNSPATIDADFRNEIGVLFDNFSKEDYTIHAGDRIAQFVLSPVYHFKAQQVDSIEGIGGDRKSGFGGTGK